jgi:hypothetical protein
VTRPLSLSLGMRIMAYLGAYWRLICSMFRAVYEDQSFVRLVATRTRSHVVEGYGFCILRDSVLYRGYILCLAAARLYNPVG